MLTFNKQNLNILLILFIKNNTRLNIAIINIEKASRKNHQFLIGRPLSRDLPLLDCELFEVVCM